MEVRWLADGRVLDWIVLPARLPRVGADKAWLLSDGHTEPGHAV